jgi:hypothetical protein
VIESAVHIKWAADVADHDYAAAEAYRTTSSGLPD